MPLKNLTLSVLPQFWIGWGLGTGKEHKCFSSLYLKQMLTSAQIKQVCNWSNTAFRRCVMLGLVYIAAVHVVCEYHTWHFEDSWLQSLLTNPLRPGPCQQTWCWASDGVIQTSLVFRLVLSLIPISANVWFFLAEHLLESSTSSPAVVGDTEAPEPCVLHRISPDVMWALALPQTAKLSLAHQLAWLFCGLLHTSVFRI